MTVALASFVVQTPKACARWGRKWEFDMINRDTAPDEFDPSHKDAKLLRWVMRQVAKELRDDPEFVNPVYERMAVRIIAHLFTLFARWLAFAVVGSAVGALLIWLGTIGVFFR